MTTSASELLRDDISRLDLEDVGDSTPTISGYSPKARPSDTTIHDRSPGPPPLIIPQNHNFVKTPGHSYRRSKSNYFEIVDGGPERSTEDATTVDIVAIPCPGVSDRYSTWSRSDPVTSLYERSRRSIPDTTPPRIPKLTAATSARVEVTHSHANTPIWVRDLIRRDNPEARVLLARSDEVNTETTLEGLADSLLKELLMVRARQRRPVPLFFMCHSVGGLVVKVALMKARKDPKYEELYHNCFGVAFFGTPHRGSIYLSMRDISESVKDLLHLSNPLSPSLVSDLRPSNQKLPDLNDEFRERCSDMQLWTFYETKDSEITCLAPSPPASNISGPSPIGKEARRAIRLSASITAIRSAIVGSRREKVYPLQTDHRCAASFGEKNWHTRAVFLADLTLHIKRAVRLSQEEHKEMDLESSVLVEVHGYYEDIPVFIGEELGTSILGGSIRPWSYRGPLKEFLKKGAQSFLNQRFETTSPHAGGPMFNRNGKRLSEPNLHAIYSSDASEPHRHTYTETPRNHRFGIDQDIAVQEFHFRPRRPVSPSPTRKPNATRGFTRPVGSSHVVRKLPDDVLRGLDRPGTADGVPGFDGVVRVTRTFSAGSLAYAASGTAPGRGPRPASVERRNSHVMSPFDPARNEVPLGETVEVPDATTQRFAWVHLPLTIPIWVEATIRAMEKDGLDTTGIFTPDRWTTRFSKGRHAQHYASFMKPTALLDYGNIGSPLNIPRSPQFPPHGHPAVQPTLTFHMPYLHYDLYPFSVRRRQLIDERLDRGRSRPVPSRIATLDSLELKAIWEYLDYEAPINCRRTLDQYGFPTLQDTRARDDDQMLYKMTKERYSTGQRMDFDDRKAPLLVANLSGGSGETGGSFSGSGRQKAKSKLDVAMDLLNGNVLMVDQLWMWAIGPKTLITSFPSRESDPSEGPLYMRCDLRDTIFNDANADFTRRCEDSFDMAGLVILHTVTVLLERPSHQDLEVFRIFEEAISQLNEKLTSALKKFRISSGIGAETLISETEHANEGTIRQRYLEENERIERENKDSTSALLELRDLEDELATIANLLATQKDNITKIHAHYADLVMMGHGAHGREYVAEALSKVQEFIDRIAQMRERVTGTREEYDKLLEMVQRRSQISEVRLQRLQADLASAQGRSVLIFTTFTVIFLPLSFFTSLYGMNTREWQADVPTLANVGSIALPISAAVILLTLMVAWSTHTRAFFRAIGRGFLVVGRLIKLAFVEMKRGLALVAGQPLPEFPPSLKPGYTRNRQDNGRRNPSMTKAESDLSFWGVPAPTKQAYEIPASNRRSVAIKKSGQLPE